MTERTYLTGLGDPYTQYGRKDFQGAGGTLPGATVLGSVLYWDSTQWVATSVMTVIPGDKALVGGTIFWIQRTAIDAFVVGNSGGSQDFRVNTDGGEIFLSAPTAVFLDSPLAESRATFTDIQHGLQLGRVAVSSSPYTVVNGDCFLAVNTGAARTINLPTAASLIRRILVIKDASGAGANVNNITIARNGADTIDQVAGNLILNTLRASVSLISDGTSNWEIW